MNRLLGAPRWLIVVLVAAAAFVVPTVFGFSAGITKDNAPGADAFNELGCTACHGPGESGHHDFATGSYQAVAWNITAADGTAPQGNIYEPEVVYTINISLDEKVAPEAENHAGFSLRVDGGQLAGVEGISKASEDGVEATHVDPLRTQWEVTWTAPADGAVVFDLFVNDVDGSGAPDAGDAVHWVGFWMTDDAHARPGAIEEHEAHVGVPLPQYWLGLIALAGMLGVIVFSFAYIRFMSPHHTDKKDRS